MSQEINPYLAPQSDFSAVPTSVDFYVDGKDLICRSSVSLPARCIKTNQPVEPQQMKSKAFYWMNPWFYLLILVSVLVLIIVHFCVRKRCDVSFGLSQSARKKRLGQMLGFWVTFLGSFGLLVAGAGTESSILLAAGIVALIGSLIWLTCIGTVLRIKKQLPSGLFALRGCCPEYLAAIDEEISERNLSNLV